LPDIPKETARQSEVLVAKLYLRKGKPDEAEKRLEALARGLSAGDADKPFIDAYLAEARIALGGEKAKAMEKPLQESLKATADGPLRGVLHNLLGEVALKDGKNESAFWHFLRVDAMYNDLLEEQGRALHHLSTLFDTVKKDPARAKDCLRRLAGKGFEGTRYHKAAKKKLDELEPPEPKAVEKKP
ncbi:MAG: hypothetical protein K2W96_05140, partial [Gemmataceae bacterium]|nr:hypothetical protein [Gemmataceae bacterium]